MFHDISLGRFLFILFLVYSIYVFVRVVVWFCVEMGNLTDWTRVGAFFVASDGLVGLAMEFGRLWVGFVMKGFLWSGFVPENVLEA